MGVCEGEASNTKLLSLDFEFGFELLPLLLFVCVASMSLLRVCACALFGLVCGVTDNDKCGCECACACECDCVGVGVAVGVLVCVVMVCGGRKPMCGAPKPRPMLNGEGVLSLSLSLPLCGPL